MDKVIVREKLAALRHRLERIEEDLPPTYEDFENNPTAEGSVLWNFCQAVQQCVDVATHVIVASGWEVPRYMRDTFDMLHQKGVISAPTAKAMRGAVTIRNIATHRYVRLDLRLVYAACAHSLDDFREFASVIGTVVGYGGDHGPGSEPGGRGGGHAPDGPPSANAR